VAGYGRTVPGVVSHEQSLELDPGNEIAVEKPAELRGAGVAETGFTGVGTYH